MLGIVCEKPSAKAHFAEALGGVKGTYNGERYVLAAMHGHLYEFAQPHEMVPKDKAETYRTWNLNTLPWSADTFDFHLVPRPPMPGRPRDTCADDIANLFAREGVTEVVCATDDDPSGEGTRLFAELVEMKKLDKGRTLSRMFFADEAPASIQKAFKSRVRIPSMKDDPDNKKAYFRQRWDLLGGMGLTRAATLIANTEFLLRNGRLKSYATARVGDQLAARAAYKKVIRFQRRFRDENGVLYTDAAQAICDKKEQVPGRFHTSDVVVDSTVRKKKAPPKLIDLGGLSSMLAPKGISPKTVLSTYQKMYEAHVVSYPRTEDKCITLEQFNELLPHVDAIARVVDVDARLCSHRTPRSTHVKEGMAHGANRPGPKVPNNLSGLDSQFGPGAALIYEALAKSYLAMLAEDFEYDRQSGHVKDYPTFIGAVNVPRVDGYKAVLASNVDKDDEENEKGLGRVADPIIYEVIPPKPAQPTVKWLMSQFEKHDVGTGATRTSCISDITTPDRGKTKSQLMTEKKGVLDLTTCGQINYHMTKNTRIASLELTRDVFAQMDDIAAGKLDSEAALSRVEGIVAADMKVMRENALTLKNHIGNLDKYMRSANVSDIEYAEGIFEGKSAKFKRVFGGHRFTDVEVDALFSGKSVTVTLHRKSDNAPYQATGALAYQTYKGRKYLGFKLPERGVPDTWSGRAFSDAEKRALEAGFAIAGTFTNSKGKTYTAMVCYASPARGKAKKIIPDFASEWPKKVKLADMTNFK